MASYSIRCNVPPSAVPRLAHRRRGPCRRFSADFALTLVLILQALAAGAADWPMWRFDAGRTAYTPAPLPDRLVLRWRIRLPRPRPCWPWTQYKLRFDASYEPVIAGRLLFVSSMVQDSVTAYDIETGQERWRFYADGPVRFAPAVYGDRLFFTSDDGSLYCLDPTTGRLVWKTAGAPESRRVLGNGRLISSRPARGGPVVFDGTVYFAAGIWPFMGTFIHAVDPRNGRPRWSNTGSGQIYSLQPHSSPAFGGVAPQGPLAVCDGTLLVPGGRSVPAAYDRGTGEFLYYHHAANKKYGGFGVAARRSWFVNHGEVYDLKSGDHLFSLPVDILSESAAIGLGDGGTIDFWALGTVREKRVVRKDRRGRNRTKTVRSPVLLQRLQLDVKPVRLFLQAGRQIFGAAADRTAFAVPVPRPPNAAADVRVSWQYKLPAAAGAMLAGAGRLVVATVAGDILCFGPPGAGPPAVARATAVPEKPPTSDLADARRILADSDLTGGRALVLGSRGRPLAEALLDTSPDIEQLVLISEDKTETRRTREAWSLSGIYGVRAAVLPGTLLSLKLAPYCAALVVAPAPRAIGFARGAEFAKAVFEVLRPYGGSAWLRLRPEDRRAFAETVRKADLANADLRVRGEWVQLVRSGALPGAGTWVLQYGNAANTVRSTDQLVRPPFGVLWFGGPPNRDVLPRHGHGPPEQVVGGRLFIEGIRLLSARDVYTGKILWQAKLPEMDTFGMYYDATYRPDPYDLSYNQVHIPGANAYGTNFAATADRVYIAAGEQCRVLDAATGALKATFRLPPLGDIARPRWGYIGVLDDLLLVGAVPVFSTSKTMELNSRFGRGSRWMVALDRHDGTVLWRRPAQYNFRHNTVVAAGKRVFCIDGMTPERLGLLRRRGIRSDAPAELMALDSRTGRKVWSTRKDVFGTWLGYSAEFDVLLEAGSRSSDRLRDEVGKGMAAFRGRTGELLWRNQAKYLGPCIIYRDRIITQVRYGTKSASPGGAYSLRTGEPILAEDPLTGASIPWAWVRFYGCNTAIGGEDLLTFRSATASYLDLRAGHGVVSLGGFKSGCTSNLVPADGVLNAPDYTRTCTCAYPNQASLALVNADDVEEWSFEWFPPPAAPTPVKRVGLNLGAPGNHTDSAGVLWLEVPSVGGPSPDIPVWTDPERPRWFRRYSLYVSGPYRWVAASGAEGLRSLVIRPFRQPASGKKNSRVEAWTRNVSTLGPVFDKSKVRGEFSTPALYTVRLFFAEFAGAAPGERLFDVALQGGRVVGALDVCKAAGGPDRTLVREFRNVAVRKDLTISLTQTPGSKRPPLLCGVELNLQQARQ
ncbi:MAG: PQQ-binding-like beta-propeller repeat protein [Kiritimatiellaeota bacterium]|nr:PQQ-binding-like beta-propeller repeat protein [Kiritimatiellota bacterium]